MKVKLIESNSKRAFLTFLTVILTVSLTVPLSALTGKLQPITPEAVPVTVVKVEPAWNEFGNSSGDPIPIPGTRFTVSVKVYNVTDLYGFGIQFNWSTTYLSYVSHSVKVPVNTNPGGVLYSPVMYVADTVHAAEGWYDLAYSSLTPAPSFNGSGTVFTMTFDVINQPPGIGGIHPIDTLLDFMLADLSDSQAAAIPRTLEPATVRIWEKRSPAIIKLEPALSEFGNSAGDHIPIPGTQFTISANITNVVNLYSFDLKFKWNTTYLSYVNHLVLVPRDIYTKGVLYWPFQAIKDEVDATTGTCWVSYASQDPAPSFSGSGIAFIIILEIIKQPYYNETGTPAIEPIDILLNFTSTELLDKAGTPIEHTVEAATVRIWEKRWLPIIRVEPALIEYHDNAVGENFTVKVEIIGVENLYGFDINFTWNPTYLEYLNHTVTIPVENFTEGILHEPVFNTIDNVDAATGRYQIVYTSRAPAPSFNGSGTVFNMTFRIKYHPLEPEPTVYIPLTLESTDLADMPPPEQYSKPINHTRENGLVILWQRPFEPKPVLKVQPPKTVLSGGTFQINITINDLDTWWDLKGFDIKLSFDPSVLQATNVTSGPFLASYGDTLVVIEEINNNTGYVWFAETLLNRTAIPEGSGVLFTITFINKTYTPTTSVLSLYETDLAADINQTKWGVPWSMPIPHTTVDGIFIQDITLPIVEITYPSEGAYINQKPVWINGTVTEDNIDTQTPTINDTRFSLTYWNPATGDFAFSNNTAITEGSISIMVSFTDLAGLTGTDSVTFTLDFTLPTITGVTQYPLAANVQPANAVIVNATVTDALSGVKNVTLWYSTDNGTTWHSVNMTLVGNIYTATIPAQPYCTNVSYKIEAYDKANNKRTENKSGEYYLYHVIPEYNAAIMMILTLLLFSIAAFLGKTVQTKKRSAKWHE